MNATLQAKVTKWERTLGKLFEMEEEEIRAPLPNEYNMDDEQKEHVMQVKEAIIQLGKMTRKTQGLP